MKTSNYGERLYAVMEAKKVDRKSLAAAIGKTVQAVGQVINGKSKALAAESHQKAVDFLGCSGAWLAEGKGEMFLPDAAQPAGHIKTDVQELTTAISKVESALGRVKATAASNMVHLEHAWPFKNLTREQWLDLTDEQRAVIETVATSMLTAHHGAGSGGQHDKRQAA